MFNQLTIPHLYAFGKWQKLKTEIQANRQSALIQQIVCLVLLNLLVNYEIQPCLVPVSYLLHILVAYLHCLSSLFAASLPFESYTITLALQKYLAPFLPVLLIYELLLVSFSILAPYSAAFFSDLQNLYLTVQPLALSSDRSTGFPFSSVTEATLIRMFPFAVFDDLAASVSSLTY